MESHSRLLVSIAPMLQVMGGIPGNRPRKLSLYALPSSVDAIRRGHGYRYRSTVLLVIALVAFLTMILMLSFLDSFNPPIWPFLTDFLSPNGLLAFHQYPLIDLQSIDYAWE